MTIQKILLQYTPERENLLRAVKEINRVFGCFDAEAAEQVAKYFSINSAAVYSAASFYDEIRKEPFNGVLIQVCDGINCMHRSGGAIVENIERLFGIKAGDINNSKVRLERISCIGRCLQGPIVIVNGTIFENVNPSSVDDILRSYMG